MICLALIAALSGSPSSGTILVDGGPTASSRTVTLPAAPSWASAVRVRVRHATSVYWGWETDQYGGLVTWEVDAAIRAGWTLSDDSGARLASARCVVSTSQGGAAIPFDGTFDWDGVSGAHEAHVLPSESAWVSMPVGVGPLTLATRATSAWTIDIHAPFFPASYGSVTWLNSTRWTAEVDWAFE